MIRTSLATQTSLLSKYIIKKLGKGSGEAAPGLLALKIDPRYIYHRQKFISTKILVTGTNGKTTTTHMLGKIFQNAGKKILTNPHGSNLSRGIAAALSSDIKADIALWETDEAAFSDIFSQTKPTHLILTNLFRDQLDRYGELDNTVNKWLKILKFSPALLLIINADDPNLEYIAQSCPQHKVIRFGISSKQKSLLKKPESHGDTLFCPKCNNTLCYKFAVFSHLGSYYCDCGFKRGKLDFEIRTDKHNNVIINNKNYISALRGIYSAYNIGATVSLADNLKINSETINQSISDFVPSFGRQETFNLNNKEIKLLLMKNPTSANQNINQILEEDEKLNLLIVINDFYADGQDVSWLWDVKFDLLIKRTTRIVIAGTRALDMGVRLKYAGFDMRIVHGVYDTQRIHSAAKYHLLTSPERTIYVLPTYTAMIELRDFYKNY